VKTAVDYPKSRGVIVASTYRNLKDYIIPMLTDELWEKMGSGAWDEMLDSFNKQDLIIRLRNGSEIYLRSCDDPDNLRGPNLSWFAIDEASRVPGKVWKIMTGRARIAPEKGWIVTTPRGRNWIYDEFAKRKRKNYEYFTGSTLENKALSEDYKKSLLECYSGSFLAQEVYGQFVGWEGLVYNLNLEDHHRGPIENPKYSIAGVDWGWIDPTVILVGQVGFDNHIHIIEEYYRTKAPMDEVAEVASRMKEEHNVRTFWCDSARPEYIQELRNHGLDARKAKKELDAGISVVNKHLESKLLSFDFNACPETIDEADLYHYEEDDMGSILKSKPVDKNNHCMDALRYLVYSNSRAGHVSSKRGYR